MPKDKTLKNKTDVEHLTDILAEFPRDDLRTALASLVFFRCPPGDRPVRIDRCTGQCTQVTRLVKDITFPDGINTTGPCGRNSRVIAESIVRGEWEYDWTDDQACSGKCRCGAEGDGEEVDRYTESRAYDETLRSGCRLRFIAKFIVVKRRRSGECRPA